MKNTRRFISAVMALAMVSALAPMGAFAADGDPTTIKQDSTTKSGTMTATYDVSAKYTVTIPAGVTLSDTATASQSIVASDVVLESGQKITVKLTGASNTESGASFSAKTTKGDSTATYTIGKGEATTGISVGDTVAEFTGNGTQALTFSKVSGATHAGTHTETLTFGISVENAVTTKKFTLAGKTYSNINNNEITYSIEIEYTDDDTWGDMVTKYNDKLHISNSGYIMLTAGRNELKNNASTNSGKRVSTTDKVSDYSTDGYYIE